MQALATNLQLLGGLLGMLAALLAGHLWGRGRRSGLLEERANLQAQLRRAEGQIGEQSRSLGKMRVELDTVANLALSLPHVVRDLNRNDIEPADVPRLILTLAESIFQPRQILLYRLNRGSDGKKVLRLSAERGFDDLPPALNNIPIGQGKIGWVAENGLDMLPDDWAQLNRTENVAIQDNHPTLQADMIGPLVHHAREGARILGVLCIGSARIRPRDEKLMFQMVTNFGSMALINARNMSQLRSQADHDGLTKLFNKRSFLDKLAPPLLVGCENKAQPFSIFIFDIDNFKTYNDTNGHPAGDQLLRQMGEIVRQHLRPNDLGCRYGGEEFVIAMPNTANEEALAQAEKLRGFVEAQLFAHREKQPKGFVSISGGVASSPKDGTEVGVLVQHADEALYQSKRGGRNRIAPYRGVEIGDSAGGDELALAATAAALSHEVQLGSPAS